MSQTKDKIIQVLVEHIKQGNNLNDISLSKVAQEAEIGKSTVYEHFKNKEEMISSTYAYLLNKYHGILLEDIPMTTFKASFIAQIKRILCVMSDAKSVMDAIMNTQLEGIPSLNIEHQKLMENIQDQMSIRFTNIMALGIQSNEIQVHNITPFTKNIIQALISGLLLQYVKGEMDLNDDGICELVYQQVLKVLS
ncbi:MAG: TetR/AcrR family transcriptional regulator [Acholeplasma sp.]|jgi:AcrR family transcriptional regulator|nr:TetR/AcrR family transcriptional regulator [Acholeplasma sp.]